MSAPQRVRAPHFTWVTEVATGDEHAITDSDYDHAMATNAGTYLALCGDDVSPAPMVQAPNGRCRACMGSSPPGSAFDQRTNVGSVPHSGPRAPPVCCDASRTRAMPPDDGPSPRCDEENPDEVHRPCVPETGLEPAAPSQRLPRVPRMQYASDYRP